MGLTPSPKVIGTIAYYLHSSESEAAAFYDAVCRRLPSRPSLLTILDWLQQPPAVITAEAFVQYALSQKQSSEKEARHAAKHRQAAPAPHKNKKRRAQLLANRAATSTEMEKAMAKLAGPVADLLLGNDRGSKPAARVFLNDMFRIFPRALRQQELFLRALKRCSHEKKVSVDEVWYTMRKIQDPGFDYVHIVSIPMGGKT